MHHVYFFYTEFLHIAPLSLSFFSNSLTVWSVANTPWCPLHQQTAKKANDGNM